jgi:DNA-binding NtrC family response regulator
MNVILLLHHSVHLARSIELLLSPPYHVISASSHQEALSTLLEKEIGLLIVEGDTSSGEAARLILEARGRGHPGLPVILLTRSPRPPRSATGDPAEPFPCIRVRSPFQPDELLRAVDAARQGRKNRSGLSEAVHEAIVRASALAYQLPLDSLEKLSRVSRAGWPVLLIGERGTGKTWAARWLHLNMGGKQGIFRQYRSGSLSPDAVDAIRSAWLDHFASPGCGLTTCYFDDISTLPENACAPLLELFDMTFLRRKIPGGKIPIRIVASSVLPPETWNHLPPGVCDLLRTVFPSMLFLPPLRGRSTEVETWASDLLSHYARELDLPAPPSLSAEALRVLGTYHWPGNFNEFRTVLARAVLHAAGGSISGTDLREAILAAVFEPTERLPEAAPPPLPGPAGDERPPSHEPPELPLTTLESIFTEMAHEIKNPLVSIQTFTQLLNDKFNDEEFRDYYANIVRGDVQRIDTLLSEMIEYARVRNPNCQTTDLREALENELSSFEEAFQERGIAVQWNRGNDETRDAQPLQLSTDGALLRYACRNIIMDALNKIPKGGYFRIEADVSAGRVKAGERLHPRNLVIRIEYPFSLERSAEAEKVLHPQKSLRREFFGLRLTIAREILHKIGGKLTCEDTLAGTTKIVAKVADCNHGKDERTSKS